MKYAEIQIDQADEKAMELPINIVIIHCKIL